MELSRIVEYVFFFGLLVLAGYMVWLIAAPFLVPLALAAIIVTICHPLYERIRRYTPRQNRSFAALATTVLVLILIILPVVFISSLVAREVVSFYQVVATNPETSLASTLDVVELAVQRLVPDFELDLGTQLEASGAWFAGNLGAIFAGTLSTIFVFFISIIGSFYFFRDGRELLDILVKASPLPDHEDEIILRRLGNSVRSVATGTVLVAIIQGSLVAIGFTLFGIERAVLWGSLASLGALIPGVGTTIVTAPAILYLFITGDMINAILLLVWSVALVGFIDNLIGPYLMSRGNNMHPFLILIAVLGGISLIGPIGFILGPVIVSLFLVLLEVYNQYIVQSTRRSDSDL